MAEKKKGKKKGGAVQGEEDEKLTKLQKKVLHWLRDSVHVTPFCLITGPLEEVSSGFIPVSKD